MIHSFIDYYIFFILALLLLCVLFTPKNYFKYENIFNGTLTIYHLNIIYFLVKIVKVAIVYILIFYFLGCQFVDPADDTIVSYDEVIFKNFFVISRILFFIFMFFCLHNSRGFESLACVKP